MTLLSPPSLAELLGATRLPQGLPAGKGVAFHSAKVRPGDVFFALPGQSGHGIDHADQALAAGAAYLVSDKPHPRGLLVADAEHALLSLGRHARGCLSAQVIGITGSVGKTTTKAMAVAALGGRATPGNLNTPPALVAALVEAAMSESGQETNRGALTGAGGPLSPLVLELGIDRLGEMRQLVELTAPDHGVITAIGEAHLSAFGDIEGVAAEKSVLLQAAPGVRLAGAEAARHLNAGLLAHTTVVRLLPEGAVAAHQVAADRQGPQARAAASGSPAPREVTARLDASGWPIRPALLEAFGGSFALPWPSRAMAENALLALTLAVQLGVDAPAAAAAIANSRLEARRLHRRQLGPGGEIVLLDDSYNASPLSMSLALETLRSEAGPRVAFLADMLELGDWSAQRHRELGAATGDLDLVVAVGEQSRLLLETNPRAKHAADALAAAAWLPRLPRPCTVLVKGSRGMRMERLVALIEAFFGDAGTESGRGSQPAKAGGSAPGGPLGVLG